MIRRTWVTAAVVGLAALLIACQGEREPRDPREQLENPLLTAALSAVPPEVARRGVFIYDPLASADLFPGTFAGADLAVMLADAAWVVESGVPPLVVASGYEGSDAPEGARIVDGILIAAADPADAEAAERRVREEATVLESLRRAQVTFAPTPLIWIGPADVASAAAAGLGGAHISLDRDHLRVTVEAPDPEATADAMREELASGALPSSPGRRWSDLLRAPKVAYGEDVVSLEAGVEDLPAALLRQLIDTRSLAFVTSA